jgi:acyl-CoA hydrolase
LFVTLAVVNSELPLKRPDASAAPLHQYMMPEHANPVGTVHGGLIMKMVDEAGAIAAMRHAQRPVVTIAVDSMTFKSPVHVGQLVTLQACITYVGRTSMEVAVRVLAEDPVRGLVTHTNSAYLVYVALDDNQRPTQVPGLLLETAAEREEFERGRQRQLKRTASD